MKKFYTMLAIAALLSGLWTIVALAQVPPAVAQLTFPISDSGGKSAIAITWGQLVTIIAALSAAHALITRLVISPMIEKRLADFEREIAAKFLIRDLFGAHLSSDDERHDDIKARLEELESWRPKQ